MERVEKVNLKQHTTFGINSLAKTLIIFDSVEDLTELKSIFDTPFMVLGGGSNILFTKDFEGSILKNEIKGISSVYEDEETIHLRVGAGTNWHEFVLYCIDKNYGGVENLSLIPGSVGASPMQNIGAYGVEIKDVFVSLEAFLIDELMVKTFDKETCKFGYRESIFKHELKNKAIITSVTFKLTKTNHTLKTHYGAIETELESKTILSPTIKDISNAVIAIRESKLPNPKEIGNAGSFFKNPVVEKEVIEKLLEKYPDAPHYPAPNNKVKLAAGWLIEKAGWKGKRIDNYGVHTKQALVLVNYGGASGKDIYALSTAILEDVWKKFNVRLEREVNIV
ncbi:MAG: UDP-N-acetylmuramate dehydrogenase [Lishizhenia sp.]